MFLCDCVFICFVLFLGGNSEQPWPDWHLPPPHPKWHESIQPAYLCQGIQQVTRDSITVKTRANKVLENDWHLCFCFVAEETWRSRDLFQEEPLMSEPSSEFRALTGFCINWNVLTLWPNGLVVLCSQVPLSSRRWRQLSCSGCCGRS